ncbi:unnamed protein product [Fraxinus pennsylvanica]|uniref:Uncharacterized protein n=1 Tax=Fraxinus pennsylvanica TaxID=56036 RepID=A0AAD2A047_9LAMI|nr:unnamed protein product [Fraxinus pennsylvanica]
MLCFDRLPFFFSGSGLVKEICWSILKGLLVLCYALSTTDADLLNKPLEAQVLSPATVPFTALAMHELPQPADHKARQNLLAPHGAPCSVAATAQPSNYGPFITSSPPSMKGCLSTIAYCLFFLLMQVTLVRPCNWRRKRIHLHNFMLDVHNRLQISTKRQDYLVDTISLHDVMGILRPVFAHPGICKAEVNVKIKAF